MKRDSKTLQARLGKKLMQHAIEMIELELCPPEPQLLDTCVIQNLDWLDRQIELHGTVTWDDTAVAALRNKYGTGLADDLIDVGILYKEFEKRSSYPWLVPKPPKAKRVVVIDASSNGSGHCLTRVTE